MYINIGKNCVVTEDDIIGIFDLDTCAQSGITKNFFQLAEKEKQVINAAEDIPNSFLLCQKGEQNTVFLAQSPSRTLYKRLNSQEERSNTWRK